MLMGLSFGAVVAGPIRAQDCGAPPPMLGESHAVGLPAPVLLACRRDGAERIATRRVLIDGQLRLLLADPATLVTSVELESCWRCAPLSEDAFGRTRFGQAVRRAAGSSGQPLGEEARRNAGLTGGQSEGAFLTADLCPSRKPLDRAILARLARERGTPVALAVSGAWLRAHPADIAWLAERARSSQLELTFVNHSDHHRVAPGQPPGRNFMILPDTDAIAEILGAERAMLAVGATPSVFFRFPGLISNAALARALADLHLVNLGSNAWLALGEQPKPGSIILTHMNGNEPAGLVRLSVLLDQGRLRPLRPLFDAP